MNEPLNQPCKHAWVKDWTDGITGRIVCDICKKGIILPASDLGFWSARESTERGAA